MAGTSNVMLNRSGDSTLFADDTILYKESPKDAARKLLEL